MSAVHHKRTCCRACGGERLTLFLELGPQPLANSFLASAGEFAGEAAYPLDVYFCETCSLVQLLDVIDPEVLFRDYIYVTGTSDTITRHNVDYARAVADLLQLGPGDLVVEAASNNGTLLQQFQALGVSALGVEPAANLAEVARQNGIETDTRFFNSDTARGLRESYGRAKAVIANNVLAHVDNTIDFLSGARYLLADGGMVIFEVPYLVEMLDRLEYDTVYHEHLCYFSVMALQKLCESAGLGIARIDRVPVHGGSLRVYAAAQSGHAADAVAMAGEERRAGLDSIARYRKFAANVAASREMLQNLLCRLRTAGRSIAGYGAPAKGNTLLNYCGIDTSFLPFTVDKNERKVGLYTPGMHIPVRPVSALLEEQPDDVLILAWNYAGEIISQQQAYRARGGRFITPVPQPVVH
ncbi:MAG TPA: class I SAM-dependent methyltransferase [Bryobacteraceae bacterium]|nr:class I SAM-dependent methyltransferase [Bryobacteraceae bacterium]